MFVDFATDRPESPFAGLARVLLLGLITLTACIALSGCVSRRVTIDDCVVEPLPEPGPIEPIPDPIGSGPELPELTFAAPENIIEAIRQILGDSGDIPPTKPLGVDVGSGFKITLPVGATMSYQLHDDGNYRFVMNAPKPAVSGNLFGLLSPRIAAVTIKPDNTGVAAIAHSLGTTNRAFEIKWNATGSAGANSLPEVWAYTKPYCGDCRMAKIELDAAKDLPFQVVWKPSEEVPWKTTLPLFWWHTSKDKPSKDDTPNTRQQTGWRGGLKSFSEKWKASRGGNRIRDEPAASPVSSGRRYVRHTPGIHTDMKSHARNVPSVIAHLRQDHNVRISFDGWSLQDLLDLHSDCHAGLVDWSLVR